MKSVIFVTLALVAIAAAASLAKETSQIVEQTFVRNPDGSYEQGYKTDDGSYRTEFGRVKQTVDQDNKPIEIITIEGKYGYINSENQNEEVKYFADENGYSASGPSIPTNPPSYYN